MAKRLTRDTVTQIRAVGREEEEMRPGLADGRAGRRALVHAEVVEHDDVAWAERRRQRLLDPGPE
jgi:hypothetical protein